VLTDVLASITAILLTALLAATGAYAGPCRSDLPPADASYGYRYRATPDRCEGLYSQPVAGEELELLSFLSGPGPSNPDSGRALTITAPDVHGLNATAQVTVVGRALPPRVYYRMDASIPSAGSLTWSLNDVVTAAHLDPAWIGLTGSVHTDKGTVYVPLRIDGGRVAGTAGTTTKMVFRSSVDLDSLHWRLYEPGSPAPPWNRIDHPVHAGDTVSLALDSPAGKEMTLDVAARPAGADYIQSRFKIFRP
jgi:hypothetical protein